MTRILAVSLLLLTACASPAPEFIGARETRIVRGGREFAVFRQGNRAEAIRLGYATRAERQGMLATLVAVMEQATGCTPVPGTIEGDTGEIRARLRCPKAKA